MINAANRHCIDRRLAVAYSAFGTPHEPTFDLVEIEHGRTAQILLGHGLTVYDLSDSRTLVECIDIKKAILEQPNRDRGFGVSLMLMESIQWADRWRKALEDMLSAEGLSGRWMPVLATHQELEPGRGYEIQFMNRDDLNQTHRALTNDPTIKEFLSYFDSHLENMTKKPRRSPNIKSDVEAPDGMNSALVVQALIEFFNKPNQPDDSGDSSLPTALMVHSYLNKVQMGTTAIQDISKTITLVKTLMRGEEAAEGALLIFGKTLSRMAMVSKVASAVGEGIGVAFGGISVGLDAYELAHAEDSTQKGVFGTQLAFDSTNLAVGIASIGAGLVGAASAAAVLGGAAVILSGLAIAFGALAEAFGKVAHDAEAVGNYFADVDDAYERGGYKYDEVNKYMILTAN